MLQDTYLNKKSYSSSVAEDQETVQQVAGSSPAKVAIFTAFLLAFTFSGDLEKVEKSSKNSLRAHKKILFSDKIRKFAEIFPDISLNITMGPTPQIFT
jgi:hypothetical protein